MKHFKKCLCVIDACSIITLDGITLARKSLLKMIRDDFDVRVCSTIRTELKRHPDLLKSREASFWPRFASNHAFHPKVLNDDNILRDFYTNPPGVFVENDAGERGNLRVSLELFLSRSCGHMIYLSDDLKARNAFLVAAADAFPCVQLWTTTNVVLYIGAAMMKDKRSTWDEVQGALRDLRTNAGNIKAFNSFDKNELISLAGKHRRLLTHIKRITDQWR